MQGIGLYYYIVFKTSAPDGSAFFGIIKTENASWGQDGQPISYIGNGPKLRAKAQQYGMARLRTDVLYVEPLAELAEKRLAAILTPATYADPKCLNVPPAVKNAQISETLTGQSKSEPHKAAISESMVGNDNALGHVKSDEARSAISDAKTIHTVDENTDVVMKYWHNADTGEQITLPADEEGLTGFKLGKLPKALAKKFADKDFSKKPVLTDAERARLIRD